MAFRIKVLQTIEFGGKTLLPGRLLRITRDSIPRVHELFGDRVAVWESWPDKSTEPRSTHSAPGAVEAEGWEELHREAIADGVVEIKERTTKSKATTKKKTTTKK